MGLLLRGLKVKQTIAPLIGLLPVPILVPFQPNSFSVLMLLLDG